MMMPLALLSNPVLLPNETAAAMAQIENSAEDSTMIEMTVLDQRTFFSPRLFEIERVWKTILPTIKPVKRTFMAAVQAKKMVSYGIGVRKFQKDGNNVNAPIICKIEKTKYA